MLRPGKNSNGLPSHGGTAYDNQGGYGGNSQYGGGSGYGGYGGYTGGYDNAGYVAVEASASSTPSHLSRRSKHEPPYMKYLKDKWIWAIVVGFLFFSTTLYYRGKYMKGLKKLKVKSMDEAVSLLDQIEREKKRFQRESQSNMLHRDEYKKKLEKAEEENRQLRKEKDELRVKFEGSINPQIHQKKQEEIDRMQAREVAMMKQIELLQNATARESKRAVIERFGEGPHRVKFTIKFPNEQGTFPHFVAEMAPLELMPHAVHLFLEQVAHQLWDDTVIFLNGPHVIQVGPTDYEGAEPGEAMRSFVDAKLDKLSFPEYSSEFPHEPMTIGFTGRPGGPDWYINKMNNTKTHGPGGQAHYSLREQADPCFAKIVEGQDVVRRMYDVPTYERGHDYQFYYQEPVTIVSARILELPEETKVDQEDPFQSAREAGAILQQMVGEKKLPIKRELETPP